MTSLAPGTSLTASVAMMETPVVDRTVETLTGTVWQAGPTTVVLTLANGENRQYDVPAGMKFNVDGAMKEAMELRPGMKVTATKVVESPRMELATDSVITGTTKPGAERNRNQGRTRYSARCSCRTCPVAPSLRNRRNKSALTVYNRRSIVGRHRS